MSNNTPTAVPMPQTPRFARRAWLVAAFGLIGVLSLLLQPISSELLSRAPDLAALPPLAQRAVLIMNPLILLLVATLAGAALAHRVGLRSVLAGTTSSQRLQYTLIVASAIGFALGLSLAGLDTALAPRLGPAWQQLIATAPSDTSSIAIGVLYGGLTEEVIVRWGAMSLVAFAIGSVFGKRFGAGTMVLAIVVAAAIFAAAHLPALAAQIELTTPLVMRALLLNGAAGCLYGWLFYRHHLEAAMAAHAATHVGLAAWRICVG